MTGLSGEDTVYGKAMELLQETILRAKTVALLGHRTLWYSRYEIAFRAPARGRGLTPVGMLLKEPIGPAEYQLVFSDIGIGVVDLTDTS